MSVKKYGLQKAQELLDGINDLPKELVDEMNMIHFEETGKTGFTKTLKASLTIIIDNGAQE